MKLFDVCSLLIWSTAMTPCLAMGTIEALELRKSLGDDWGLGVSSSSLLTWPNPPEAVLY